MILLPNVFLEEEETRVILNLQLLEKCPINGNASIKSLASASDLLSQIRRPLAGAADLIEAVLLRI